MKNEKEGREGGENIALQHKTPQLTSLPYTLFTAPRLMINGRVKVTQALRVFVSLLLQTIKYINPLSVCIVLYFKYFTLYIWFAFLLREVQLTANKLETVGAELGVGYKDTFYLHILFKEILPWYAKTKMENEGGIILSISSISITNCTVRWY